MQSATVGAHRCFRKRRFPTERDALRAMRRTADRPGFVLGEGERLNVYPCYDCGGYHLGRTVHREEVSA